MTLCIVALPFLIILLCCLAVLGIGLVAIFVGIVATVFGVIHWFTFAQAEPFLEHIQEFAIRGSITGAIGGIWGVGIAVHQWYWANVVAEGIRKATR